jgi:DNA-directed RNA polymerase specialized sigma24 family protein
MSRRSKTEGAFPETRWTRVLAVRDGLEASADSERALSELCETYWLPIYAYARRFGESQHEAEDMTQEFFGMVLNRDLFLRARPERGRLRSFLLGAFNVFRAERTRDARRIKRGGQQRFVPLDEALGEELLRDAPAAVVEPQVEFDRLWAQTVLHRTLRSLQEEYHQRNQLALHDQLRPFLGLDAPPQHIAAVAAVLRMTPGAFRVAIFRMRKRFRTLLEEGVADTLTRDMNVQEEIRHLAGYLANSLPAADHSAPPHREA